MIGERAKAYWKFQGRVWLTRLGLWRTLERWRLGRRFRAGVPHEPDFRFFQHFDGSRGLFVDIGANIGQSALSFRIFNRTCPILSFEANPDLEIYLAFVKRLLGDTFNYCMHGLGADDQVLDLFVPVVKGVALTQEARLSREALASDAYRLYVEAVTRHRHYTIERKRLRLRKLDDLDLRPAFVKMDVEGAELFVLQGMERTIQESRPLIFTEGHEHVDGFLAARGYRLCVYHHERHALMPFRGPSPSNNYFFVPAERTADLERCGAFHDESENSCLRPAG